jgi:TPR repeat protein
MEDIQTNDELITWCCSVMRTNNINIEKIKQALKTLHKINNKQSIEALGFIYFYGQNADVDYKKGIEFFKKSGKMGNMYSYYKLGHIYLFGCPTQLYVNGAWIQTNYPNIKDYVKANKYLNMSYNGGYKHGMLYSCMAKVHFLNGYPESAIKFLLLGGKYQSVAQKYIHGDWVPRDLGKALFYINKCRESPMNINIRNKILRDLRKESIVGNV